MPPSIKITATQYLTTVPKVEFIKTIRHTTHTSWAASVGGSQPDCDAFIQFVHAHYPSSAANSYFCIQEAVTLHCVIFRLLPTDRLSWSAYHTSNLQPGASL